MPELAAFGALGALVTFLLANLNLYLVHKSFSDPKLEILNRNLSKINWFWSRDQGAAMKIEGDHYAESLQAMDYKKATRAAFLFGTMMTFLSWLGLFLLGLYMLSIYKLAKNRDEEKIMASELADKDLADISEINKKFRYFKGEAH